MNKFRCPWLTPGLLKSINRKNRLYKKLIKSPNKSCEQQYKTYKNKLSHLIRIVKRSYYDRRFESAQKDLKLTWKLLNEVINKRKSKSPLPSLFKSEGRTITRILSRLLTGSESISPISVLIWQVLSLLQILLSFHFSLVTITQLSP